jgi:HSP20 family protein
MAEKHKEPRGETRIARREPLAPLTPFRMLDRFADEMDRVFDAFGLGHGWLQPRTEWLRSATTGEWLPEIEMFQRGDQLVIHADLPGLKKEDVKIDVTEDTLTIQGERKREHEEEKEGVYRSERSYGSFFRVVSLPEGAMSDQAKATFKDGVLEVSMPAPPSTLKQPRRIDIGEPVAGKK